MKISKTYKIEELVKPHKWWAWKPVVVELKMDGTTYKQTVWLQSVTRTLVRIQGVSVFKYEP